MNNWQQYVVLGTGVFGAVTLLKGLFETKAKRNPYGLAGVFHLAGAFVWGDAVVFGWFWMLTAGLVWYLADFVLFMLLISLFWTVRAVGEIWYWLLQQFSMVAREKPEDSILYPLYRSEAVWFGHQIIWQCVLVLSLVSCLYFATLWVRSIGW